MPVHEIDPLGDPRWAAFVESHPLSSIFHTKEWLEALHRTYRYIPIAFTTSAKGTPLGNGIVFCKVNSWLTGSKLVALPFSDHCEPLVKDKAELRELLRDIAGMTGKNFKYAEIRPRKLTPDSESDWSPVSQSYFHYLDLRPPLEDLYSGLHKDGIQRKIRRSERERVVVDHGRSELLLAEFYQLLLLTRRRHRLPPQPLAWFRNLVECLGPRLMIRVARVDGRPIASMLTLRHKQTIVYKYGCSDERFHNLGGMSALFWHAIQEAKAEQAEEFDLGRSDESNPGLVRFKDHLGAMRTSIRYWQFPRPIASHGRLQNASNFPTFQKLLVMLPDRLFRLAGEVFYRHAG